MASAKRDHLVETALGLFSGNGFHATGIDTILAESGVAEMTLDKYFKSKDKLILAALERRHERRSAWFRTEIERRARSPLRRLLVVFDVLGEWFRTEDFRGCLVLNAASEYSGLEPRIRAVVARHTRWVRDLLERLASEARAPDPTGLASQLTLLVEGAITVALVERNADSARSAMDAAKVLIRTAIPATPKRSQSLPLIIIISIGKAVPPSHPRQAGWPLRHGKTPSIGSRVGRAARPSVSREVGRLSHENRLTFPLARSYGAEKQGREASELSEAPPF